MSDIDAAELVEFLTTRLDELEREVSADPIETSDQEYLLADIAAKRRLTKLHEPRTDDYGVQVCDQCSWQHDTIGQKVHVYAPCEHLKLFALPFAGHRGYREEWRP